MAICGPSPPPLQSEKNPSCSFGCSRTHQEEYLKIPNLSLCPASPVSAGWLRTYNDLHCPFCKKDIVTAWLIYHTGREGSRERDRESHWDHPLWFGDLPGSYVNSPYSIKCQREISPPGLQQSFSAFLLLFHYIRLPQCHWIPCILCSKLYTRSTWHNGPGK